MSTTEPETGPINPTPTTRSRAGDRVIDRIKDQLENHKVHTADQLAQMQRSVEDALAAGKREDATWREATQKLLDDIVTAFREQETARAERDKVTDNQSTIVVPPSDVQPVQAVEDNPVVQETEKPKRSWKDWF